MSIRSSAQDQSLIECEEEIEVCELAEGYVCCCGQLGGGCDGKGRGG